MKTEQTNEYEKAVSDMDNAYRLYAFWSHELGITSTIVDELYADFWQARKRVEDLYASIMEA